MPRAKRPPETATYAGRVAAALAALRAERGWSIEEFQQRLARLGVGVPVSTLYAYERGKGASGVELPLDLVPTIARVYGYRTAHGWLPGE